jgi:anti-sigma B factor antagonist
MFRRTNRPSSQPPAAPSPRPTDSDESAPRTLVTPIAEIEIVGETVVATLTVTEIADEAGTAQLSELLDQLTQTGARHFVLDIQNIQFMNSLCLGSLVDALNRIGEHGGKIAMASPAHSVQSLFRLTRLDRMFPIRTNVMSAIAAVEGRHEDMDEWMPH